jgi:hypothetical protein
LYQFIFRFSDQRRYSHTVSLNHPEPAEPWGQGGICLPPDFCRFVNPIRTEGADYATHITTERTPRIFRPSAGSDKVAFFCTQQNYQVFILHFKKSNFSHSSGEIKCGLRMLPYSFQYPYYFVLQV